MSSRAVACTSVLAFVFAATLGLGGDLGCGADTRDPFVIQFDAGSEAGADADDDDGSTIDPTIGGPCSEDVQCDDGIPCTFDKCDLGIKRCRNTPDDTRCSDGQYCNGEEKCILRQGCLAGDVVTCEDDNGCTTDICVEANKGCQHLPRDVDGDGDPDNHCVPNADCDDTDPTVSSKVAEICDNFKDDNCNGQVDETPCATAANDTCATALAVTAPGTFLLSTVAAKKDYAGSCSVTESASRDIVLAITVPAGGGAKDVFVRAATSSPSNDVAVALQTACGSAGSEVGCGFIGNSFAARAISRSVAAGTTIFAIVTTASESAVDVTVDMPAGTTAPTNESCAAPTPITIGAPFTVPLIDASRDLVTSCQPLTGELTYSFTLTEPHDVRIFASTLDGPGAPIVSLRDDDCTEENRCKINGTPPLFARSLAAGKHVFAVYGTTQLDASIVVETFPATAIPPNQTCATAPPLTAETTSTVDLSNNESTDDNTCFPGAASAAYDLEVPVASDVLVIETASGTDSAGVSLSLPGCKPADLLQCSTGSSRPLRVSQRSVSAGSYRVVVGDSQGLSTQLLALVRTANAPTTVASADDCTNAFTIPESGGFFVGNTTRATATFDAGCDAPNQDQFGAKDQILRLDLTQRRRMIFDMTGSSYPTLLDIRSGSACPGIEVPNACDPAPGGDRSYLDVTLDPGTYWIQIDGYGGTDGDWNLDVRTLVPSP